MDYHYEKAEKPADILPISWCWRKKKKRKRKNHEEYWYKKKKSQLD